MNKLLWTFPADKVKNKKSVFSNAWVVSQEHIHVPLSSITDADIWLIQSQSNQHFLFGHLRIINIAKTLDNIHTDLLTLFTSKCASFQIIPRDINSEWKIKNLYTRLGIYAAKTSELEKIKNTINANKKISLKKSNFLGTKLISSEEKIPPNILARKIYSEILATKKLGELKYLRNGKTPFGEIAVQTVSKYPLIQSKLKKEILHLDRSVLDILRNEEAIIQSTSELYEGRKVDIDLQEVEPNKIISRVFISSLSDLPKDNAALEKTQRAEEHHQNILRNIAKTLLSLNLKPLQSNSIDIAVEIKNFLFIFEVKSATLENFEKQTKNSFIQILEYKKNLESVWRGDIRSVSVIEDVDSKDASKNYLSDFANYLDIDLIWFRKDTFTLELKRIFNA